MITRRDLTAAALAAAATLGLVTLAQSRAPVMGSSVYDWNAVEEKPTEYGTTRQFFRAPTATLDELEVHVTTLNAGATSHAPHKHQNEEIVIIREGTVETLVNGEWKKAGPGSVIFNASNKLHGIRNVGDGPATYHVVNWASPGTLTRK